MKKYKDNLLIVLIFIGIALLIVGNFFVLTLDCQVRRDILPYGPVQNRCDE